MRGAPLGDDELAAALALEDHGFVEGADGALDVGVGGWLGGDALEPEAGQRQQGEERAAALGGEADDLVGVVTGKSM
jgi:hypothetical protein